MTVHGYPAAIEVAKHILPVTWTLNPAVHRTTHWVGLPIIHGHVFTKRSYIELYFVVSLLETLMAKRYFTSSHVYGVRHGNIVELLVPCQCG